MTAVPGPADLIVHAMALSETSKIVRTCALYLSADPGTNVEADLANDLELLVKSATSARMTAQQTIFILASIVANCARPEDVQTWLDEQGRHLAENIGDYPDA